MKLTVQQKNYLKQRLEQEVQEARFRLGNAMSDKRRQLYASVTSAQDNLNRAADEFRESFAIQPAATLRRNLAPYLKTAKSGGGSTITIYINELFALPKDKQKKLEHLKAVMDEAQGELDAHNEHEAALRKSIDDLYFETMDEVLLGGDAMKAVRSFGTQLDSLIDNYA